MNRNIRVGGPVMAVVLSLGLSVSATALAGNHQHQHHNGGEVRTDAQEHRGHGQHGQDDNRDRGQGQKRGHDQHQGHQGHKRDGGHGGHHDGHGGHHDGHEVSVGQPGKRENVARTISITGDDTMAFRHPPISVRVGETIRFEVTNTGSMDHQFSIGAASEHRAHQMMMRDNPGMSHDDMPGSITLAPGETGEVIWLFDSVPDEPVEVACNLPGHYEAGMFSQVRIRE